MLRKYATAVVLEARSADAPLMRTAHRAVFQYEPREGYIYIRSRAISSRVNDNYDGFSAEEIEGNGSTTGYKTFIGRPVFVNHNNEDHRRARGIMIDAALHRDRNPDGTPDTWAEVLMEIDARTYPKLAKAVLAGEIDRTSMGVDVERSTCSACGNTATNPSEYCKHIPAMKGKKYSSVGQDLTRSTKLIFEHCAGLTFFENSLLVEQPADPTAFTLGKVELGPGLEHLSRVAVRRGNFSEADEPVAKVQAAFQNGQPTMSRTAARVEAVDPRIFDVPADSYPGMPTVKIGRFVQGSICKHCSSNQTLTDGAVTECFDCGGLQTEGSLVYDAAKYETPDDHPWFQAHPIHADNIVDHWKQATPDEKDQGKRWYSDAHLVAKAISNLHPSKSTHVAAGIIANYSPQQGWEGNMHNAARVLHEGKGIGGPGSGMFASVQQKKSADRILGGENYNDVLRGPKIKDFAHLIEHGGDESPESPHVVIDRHALSVAHGKALSNDDYTSAPLSATYRKDGTINRKNYDHVVNAYHAAGKRISDDEGEHVPGHAVQATTWLVRQRLNGEAAKANEAAGGDSRLDRGRSNARGNAKSQWEDFSKQHGIDVKGPGTGYQAARHQGYSRKQQLGDIEAQVADKHADAADRGHDMNWSWIDKNTKGSEPHQEGTCKNCGAQMTVGSSWSSSNGGRDARHVPCVGPDTSWQNDMVKDLAHERVNRAVSQFGQDVKDEHDKDWLSQFGSRHEAYGETKAPADVDTLRDENCPICGETTSAYDGTNCSVCGYVAPPKLFRDPDLDVAKQVDLRKQIVDPTGQNPDGTNVEDFSQTGEDVQPDLVCNNCGTEFPAGEPMTTSTTDPQAGDRGTGPADGDVCPECGKGILESPQELEEQDGAVPGQQDAEGEELDPNAPVDPNALEDPDEEEDPNAPVDPNALADADQGEDEDEPDEDDEPEEDPDQAPAKRGKFPFGKK